MENVCIRVRFSPLMKNISKNNSKCCLEIVPLVTCIENIDKIKWKNKNDKIEYIVPMNYKIIIKKLKPNRDAIKMYYSCVDLLPSLLSSVNIDTCDIYRVISDNTVFNKEKPNLMPLKNRPTLDIKLNKIMRHVNKSTNRTEHYNERTTHIDLSSSLLTLINMREKLKTGSVQTEKEEAAKNRFCRDKDVDKITKHIDNSTSTILQNNNPNYTTTANFTKNMQKRNLNCIQLYDNIQLIHEKDYLTFDGIKNTKETNSNTSVIKEIDFFKYFNNPIRRINRTLPSFPHHIINNKFDEEMIISNIRIKPEVRIAKFVEKMEKEIMPLKMILDNIIVQCSSLGLYKNVLSYNQPLKNLNLILGSNQIKKRDVIKDNSYNRVVYSIVFDE